MILLSVDTSSTVGALALMKWDENKSHFSFDDLDLLQEWTLNVSAYHSEKLLWGIDQLLNAASLKVSDIDVYGVGVGPGSFTGLRMGLMTVKTLADVFQKPIVPISSLAALSRTMSVWASSFNKKVISISVTDAGRGELFYLMGNSNSVKEVVVMADQDLPGLWKRGVEEGVSSPGELVKKIKKKLKIAEGAFWIINGQAVTRYPEFFLELPMEKQIKLDFPFLHQIQGRSLAQMTWEGLQAGVERPSGLIFPKYMRASHAEIKLKAGLLPPGPSRGSVD